MKVTNKLVALGLLLMLVVPTKGFAEEIEEVLPRTIQQEANPFIEDLERRMKEMASEEGK